MTMKQRYGGGLEKLKFAETQVDVMKEEIIAMQPELIATSEETTRILKKIQIDKGKHLLFIYIPHFLLFRFF